MKLRGRAYREPFCAPNARTCSPTWFADGVHVTFARPKDTATDTRAGRRLLRMTAPGPAATSKLSGCPALTENAAPSRGVGACQRTESSGPAARVVLAPVATATVSAARVASAIVVCRNVFVMCPAPEGRPMEPRSGRRFYADCRRACSNLAVRATPGSATAGARFLDRVAAAEAGLSVAPVDAELGLHPAGRAVGVAVVAQGRALEGDAPPEGSFDPAHEGLELLGVHVAGPAQWMEARPPERLVRVDVPDACEDALVEDDRFQRRTPARQAVRERPCRERPPERLDADLRREVRLEFARLEQEPRAEPPDVPVRDVRSVV